MRIASGSIAPTILELAGADVPDFIQGESFLDPEWSVVQMTRFMDDS